MIRRRRPKREIAFSFDSFLDVVANVVGIILRLILVAWVGARAYRGLPVSPPAPEEAAVRPAAPEESVPPELRRLRDELARARGALADQLRHVEEVRGGREQAARDLASLAGRARDLETERQALERSAREQRQRVQSASLSEDELRQRTKRLTEELAALRDQPPVQQSLRYKTPVSQPVKEELMFECKGGRASFIDIGALLDEVKAGLRPRAESLRSRWQLEDAAGPVGAFRLRYTVERERAGLDAVLSGAGPDGQSNFRYGLSTWEVEPVRAARGEAADAALADDSEFRRVADGIDPQQTAVTFWVYPDSFDVYRKLRDFLHDREVVVAGRPLPEGVPIRSSRNGTTSRGQ